MVEAADGHLLSQDVHKVSRIRNHFITQFNHETTAVISKPRPHTSINPITDLEVLTAFHRMSNGKACGRDSIPSKLLQYSLNELASVAASVINSAVARGANLSAIIDAGILVALSKTNKAKGFVMSLRSIVMLKDVSVVVLFLALTHADRHSTDSTGHVDEYVHPGAEGCCNCQ